MQQVEADFLPESAGSPGGRASGNALGYPYAHGLLMDRIIIDELELWLRVGVPDAERAEPQRLLVTVEMTRDLERAAESDDLSATIDYHAVTVRLKQFGAGKEWKLIERLASDVARLVLDEFGAEAVSVEVRKFILPDTRYVAVKIQRRKGE